MTKRILQGAFWIFVYLFITLAPLIILLVGPRPAGREFWRDLSVGLGFSGFSMLGLQFVLTARFKAIKAPYGSDIVYFFHRQISLVTFLLILAHPLILFTFDIRLLSLLNLATAPWAARFGVVSLLSVGALIGLSIWRKKLRIEYDRWRIWHGILAIAAVALAMTHIELRGYYLNTFWKQLFWGIYGFLWIGILAWNVALLGTVLYGLQGVDILKFILRRMERFRSMVIFAIILCLFMPGLNIIILIGVPLLGVSGLWIQYDRGERS